MLPNVTDNHTADIILGVPFEPPCEISDFVIFVNGACPFSGHEDCSECISSEFDAECMWYLLHSNKFGLA
jgi:hypothetical protein